MVRGRKVGFKHSEETKKKMSESHKKKEVVEVKEEKKEWRQIGVIYTK